jgi:dTDP-4-dehydrorhamnose reductase
MLGTDVARALREAGLITTVAGRGELDVRDPAACVEAVAGHDVVVGCAAWTAVDDAEAAEPQAFAVNAAGAANVARACALAGARLVHVSTDYVFDGAAEQPYPEDAAPCPTSAYGRTKAAGEWAVQALHDDALVLRTAWLYGAAGGCFPKTIAKLLGERDQLDVVADQVGQPTWTRDVADLTVRLLAAAAPPGVYHATSSGQVSWHGFALAVAEVLGAATDRVRPTTSASFVRPAPRPAYSVLGHDRLHRIGVRPVGPWRERFAVAAAAGVLQPPSKPSR